MSDCLHRALDPYLREEHIGMGCALTQCEIPTSHPSDTSGSMTVFSDFACLTESEPMVYLEKLPNPHLRSWVRSLWYCRAPRFSHRRERVLPNGCMQIILNLSRKYLTDCGEDGQAHRRLARAIVVGTRARYALVDTTDMEEIVGVVIQPGGFAGLFR